MKATFRQLSTNDVPALLALLEAAFLKAWREETLQKELTHDFSVYIGGFIEGRLVSCAGFWHIMEQADIQTVAVLPAYRKQGIGAETLECLLAAAVKRGACEATLEVRVSNRAALALYERAGFQNAGKRPRYYPDGEDAYILFKPLCQKTVE